MPGTISESQVDEDIVEHRRGRSAIVIYAPHSVRLALTGHAMKLTDETLAGINLVRAHAPGEIRVGETVIRHSCLLRADRIEPWRPQTLDALTMDDLEPLFELQPEIVILGTG